MSESAEVPVETPVVKTQDDALVEAFAAGTLPEEDRRAPELPPPPVDVPVTPSRLHFLEAGSIIERTATGWTVRAMYGGAPRLHGSGATLENALLDAGI